MDITCAFESYDFARSMGVDEYNAFRTAAATLAVQHDLTNRAAKDVLKAALAERANTPTHEVSIL